MRRPIVLALSFLLGLAGSSTAQRRDSIEQESSERVRLASDSHSFMELFTNLEHDWVQALQKKDEVALDSILAPEFMLWTSENPENPVPRAEWMQHALTSCDIRSFGPQKMAIRAFVGVAVVSFVRQETVDCKDHIGDYFIVDLWEVNHEKWQVAARYITIARRSSHPPH
jgi:hypothetical protein